MKIRRFHASDMKKAIRLVREEFGPDAVIISSTSAADRVEVIAAIDFDEKLFQSGKQELEQEWPDIEAPVQNVSPFQAKRVKPQVKAKKPYSNTQKTREEKLPIEQLSKQIHFPELDEMQREMRSMRDLLQDQMGRWDTENLHLREPLRAQLIRKLEKLGFDTSLARNMTRQVVLDQTVESAWHDVLVKLSQDIPVQNNDLLEQGGAIALIGPSGSGKTTTLAKLAARYILRKGKENVSLVCADDFRIGARSQLQAFASIMGVKMHWVSSSEELRHFIASQPEDSLVLIDTAGVSMASPRLESLQELLGFLPGLQSWLVLPANLQDATLAQTIKLYDCFDPETCILTKLDECASLGQTLSVLMKQNLKLAYVSQGPNVPEDLQPARAAKLVVRAVEQNPVEERKISSLAPINEQSVQV